MSYDIELLGPDGEPLPSEHFVEGGTYNIHGTNACELNVTYNYSSVLRLIGFHFSDIDHKTGEQSLPLLRAARKALGGDEVRPPRPYKDYWAPTPGNALVAINRLIGFAEEHPTGTWRVV